MLIEFSTSNFRSLYECQTLSLAKAVGSELSETNTFSSGLNHIKLLRSAAIYGSNASGKSNLLHALHSMRKIVLHSARGQRGDKLPVQPFRLISDAVSAPSMFEVLFIADGVRYQYGFSATSTRIHDEWLVVYPRGRPQRWFERRWNEGEQGYDWTLGEKLKGNKQFWKESTRDNALFLSTAVQLNSEALRVVYDWFRKTLYVTNVGEWAPSFGVQQCKDEKQRESIMRFLRAADLGIDDVILEKTAFDINELSPDISEAGKEKLSAKMKGIGTSRVAELRVKTLHKNDKGDYVRFDLDEDESHGTQRLFDFAGHWIDGLKKGGVMCIDELDRSLHPDLSRFLVDLFHNRKTNQNNAQLIFTTYDPSLLDQETLLRRDQIWFIEKGNDQASKLYPLTDFKPRKEVTNLERAYLSGRYGAIPRVKTLETSD